MREETHPEPKCVYCGEPITREQRPSVQLENGQEVHIQCWNKYEKGQEPERRGG